MKTNMSLREKIGQCVMVGFEGTAVSKELSELIEDYKIGNVILFSRNIENKAQTQKMCYDIHQRIENATGNPAFIATDQEGGTVTRLSADIPSVPGAMLIGSTGNPAYAYEAGRITGKELKVLGINVDLAPVADVNTNSANPVIGVRSYGSDASLVSKYVVQMYKGLNDQGIMSCAKHFPGHGDTAVDSHLGLPSIQKTKEELLAQELVPFKAAIDQGIPGIMTSHILFPRLEKDHVPATMSHAILTGLLRETLKFDGILFTDCMEMDAIGKYYGTVRAGMEAIKAGADIVSVSHTPSMAKELVLLLEDEVKNGNIPMNIIDKAVERILQKKERFRRMAIKMSLEEIGSKEDIAIIENIISAGVRKQSVEKLPEIDGNTIFIGSYPYRSSLASDVVAEGLHFGKYMSQMCHCDYVDVSIRPDEKEIKTVLEKTASYAKVVYGLFNGHLNHGQIQLANTLKDAGKEVVAVALRNPYDLDMLHPGIHTIAAYEYNELVFQALYRMLCKQKNKYLAIDIGGTYIKYSIMDAYFNETDKQSQPTEKQPEAFLRQLVDMIQNAKDIQGVAICMGGFIRPDTGENDDYSVGENFRTYNLKEELQRQTGYTISIENDSNCAAIAEMTIGAGKGCQNICVITVGTGIGGAIICNGQLVRGHHFKAGEYGFMIFGGEKQGTYKTAGATSCLIKNVSKAIGVEVDGKYIFEHLQNPEIEVVYQEWINDLALLVGNVAVAFDPEKVLVGGAISTQPRFIEDLKTAVYRIFHPLEKYTVIERCLLGNDAGKIGALCNFQNTR